MDCLLVILTKEKELVRLFDVFVTMAESFGPVRCFEKRPEVRIAFLADLRQDVAFTQLMEADGKDEHRCFIPEFGQARKAEDELASTYSAAPATDFRISALVAREVAIAMEALALLDGYFDPLVHLILW